MNWILFRPEEIAEDSSFVLRDHRAAHILEILGASPGDDLRGMVLNEARFRIRLREVNASCVTGDLLEQLPTPSRPTTDLLLALPRPKVLKRLLPQIASLGVRHLFLCKARKVEKSFFQSPVLNPETVQEQFMRGLEQVGDVWMPDVSIHRQFRSLIETHLTELHAPGRRLVLHPGEGDAWSRHPDAPSLLAIGPEGGWTPHELNLLKENNFTCAHLGERVLRTDTAVVAALSRLQTLRELAG